MKMLALMFVLIALVFVLGVSRNPQLKGSVSDTALVKALSMRFITEARAAPIEFQCPCRSGSTLLIASNSPDSRSVVKAAPGRRESAPHRCDFSVVEARIRYELSDPDAVVAQVTLDAGDTVELKFLEKGGAAQNPALQPLPAEPARLAAARRVTARHSHACVGETLRQPV